MDILKVLLLFLSTACLALAEDFYSLLGIERSANTREIRRAFKKLAIKLHPDKNPDPDAHDKFLKINRAYEVLKDEDLRKKYDTYGEEGLKEDHHSGRKYESWSFYNQNFGIYDDDLEIITLSRSDYEQAVENTDDVWFINYYSTHCSHCHDLAPTWREVARELEGVVRIGAVNCADDWMLCRQQGIRSYPSLVIYPSREKYYGDRVTRLLVRHALKAVGARVIELWTGNFASEMADSEKAHHPWLITFCGEGGGKICLNWILCLICQTCMCNPDFRLNQTDWEILDISWSLPIMVLASRASGCRFGDPKPLKSTPQGTKIFLCGISENLNHKLI